MPVPVFTSGEILTAANMNRVGLWKITPSSVSGTGASISGSETVVASGGTTFTMNGVFSSSFRNYKVIVTDFTSPAPTELQISMGTSKTGSSHKWGQVICNTSGTVFGSGNAGGNCMHLAVSRGSTVSVASNLEIMSPFLSIETNITAMSIDAGNEGVFRSTIGYYTDNTSFTALTFSTSGQNFTSCRVAIYGYN